VDDENVLWRRTRIGLRASSAQAAELNDWMHAHAAAASGA